MRVYVVMRGDEASSCPYAETARLTLDEAERYVTEQEMLALECEDEAPFWFVEEIDMPLSMRSPRIMAEATR